MAHAYGTQEGANFGDALAWAPVCDLVDVLWIGESALRGASVSDCNYFFGAEGRLESAVGAAAILGALHHVVNVLKMFPNEPVNAWVVGYALLRAIWKVVPPFRTSDRHIVDVGNCDVGYFRL